jgi:vitamin B12/bleomycin/antimicrobial peptide transport system ATP-binding/permease protein
MHSDHQSLWTRLVTIATPYFRSSARHGAQTGLAILIVLLLSVNGLNVVNSYVGRYFMDALGERNLREFYLFALALAGVFAASTAVQVVSTFVQQKIVLRWREWLTVHLLDRYLADRAYRRLSIHSDVDNPDQRISEDIRTFTDSTIGFLVLLFNAILTFIAFAGVLWSIRPILLLAAAAYAVLGSLGTILLGRPLVKLDNLQLKKEADFRFALGRVREHSGTVAQLGGEGDEGVRLRTRLDSLVSNFRAIIGVSRNLGFFTTMYNFLPQIIPVILAAPLYIRGIVELGVVMQSSMAFSQVLAAFSLIVTQFQALSAYAAVVTRLGGLWEATEPQEAAAPALAPAVVAESPVPLPGVAAANRSEGHRVSYQQLTLRTPEEGRPLVRALSLEVTEGKRVLVVGPSGAGKTALLLATAGMWESGEGRVVCPEDGGVMFLPKQPHAISGSLRELLQYGTHRHIPDDRLRSALREVGLASLAIRPGGLDVDRDWAEALSPGELELAAFAGLLAAAPCFAFLDDPASSLDAAGVKRVYEALARRPITYVSVAGHFDLYKYHDIVLELHGDGTWNVQSTDGVHTVASR